MIITDGAVYAALPAWVQAQFNELQVQVGIAPEQQEYTYTDEQGLEVTGSHSVEVPVYETHYQFKQALQYADKATVERLIELGKPEPVLVQRAEMAMAYADWAQASDWLDWAQDEPAEFSSEFYGPGTIHEDGSASPGEYLPELYNEALAQWQASEPQPFTHPSVAGYLANCAGYIRLMKLKGVEFEGVMCSATADDQFGLASIKPYIENQGMSFNFKFDNGTVLTLGPANVAAFEAVWFPFRASFF